MLIWSHTNCLYLYKLVYLKLLNLYRNCPLHILLCSIHVHIILTLIRWLCSWRPLIFFFIFIIRCRFGQNGKIDSYFDLTQSQNVNILNLTQAQISVGLCCCPSIIRHSMGDYRLGGIISRKKIALAANPYCLQQQVQNILALFGFKPGGCIPWVRLPCFCYAMVLVSFKQLYILDHIT